MRVVDSTEPSDHSSVAPTMNRMPSGSPLKLAPRISNSTPARPTSMPASSSRLGRWPNSRPSALTIMGTTAMKVAIRPEPT